MSNFARKTHCRHSKYQELFSYTSVPNKRQFDTNCDRPVKTRPLFNRRNGFTDQTSSLQQVLRCWEAMGLGIVYSVSSLMHLLPPGDLSHESRSTKRSRSVRNVCAESFTGRLLQHHVVCGHRGSYASLSMSAVYHPSPHIPDQQNTIVLEI